MGAQTSRRARPDRLEWALGARRGTNKNYFCTDPKRDGTKAKRLHREIWKEYNGEIPEGCHIHHKDGNPLNNNIENLECLTASEHHQLHMADPERKKIQSESAKQHRFLAEWREECPDEAAMHDKACGYNIKRWREENPELYKEQNKQLGKQTMERWWKEHPEEARASNLKAQNAAKEWIKNNPDKVKEYVSKGGKASMAKKLATMDTKEITKGS